MVRFGDFSSLCSQTPSYPWCNLFYRQLLKNSPTTLVGVSAIRNSAPVGINPECGILRVGSDNSLANIANIIACGISMAIIVVLIYFTSRRKAAVGRVELRLFLVFYFITLALQLITTGSLLTQGSTPLTILTAIHAGAVAALFWSLLANAIVATQIVEDGGLPALIPFVIFSLAFFGATTYIALDVAFTFTRTLGPSDPPAALASIPLFVLTSIWPAVTVVITFAIMTYIVVVGLNEIRPMWYYFLSAALFILSQLAYFLLGKVICRGSSSTIDGSFVATVLETASVGVLFLAWRSITEDTWTTPYFPS